MLTSSSASAGRQGKVFGPVFSSCESLGRPGYACLRGGPPGRQGLSSAAL